MSVPESEFERTMQKIAVEIAPHLLPRRRDDTPLKAFKLEPEEPEPVNMSGMAEVLATHRISWVMTADPDYDGRMPYVGKYLPECRMCGPLGDVKEADHQAAMLTAAGFGPIKEAAAVALEEAAAEFTERVAVTRKTTPDDGTPYATATRNHAYGMQIAAVALRARAAAMRGEG